MSNWTAWIMLIQIFFTIIIGLYFWSLIRNQQSNRTVVDKESKKELQKLQQMREISLTEPLAEKTRPSKLGDIIGQKEGLRALKAALCGPNPQHVIIYGPPGVGKTAAARVILEEAKNNSASPFTEQSQFIELDATTARFDERGIADPLIGSVHDPIYQGAGAMGAAGVPQPKPGAVTRAHGGILFIDEIGELHPIQMNKLLKVLEDRKVYLESAYYYSEDKNTPNYIHDIFQNGLPADFRMIGATTRTPDEIPAAIRSRCMEIFFRPLLVGEIRQIAEQALERASFGYESEVISLIERYAVNGRDAVNICQTAIGLALTEGREKVLRSDIEWMIHSSQLTPRPKQVMPSESKVGLAIGLAVYGNNMGMVMEIEVLATAVMSTSAGGSVRITGIVDEEEMNGGHRRLKRRSMASSSVENVVSVLRRLGSQLDHYHLHVNFPGGVPMDGPSAGITIATAIYSAIEGVPVDHRVAMTGELSIHGLVKPVGGIIAKVEAAKQAGAKRVIIPAENMQSLFEQMEGIEIIPVESFDQVIEHAFVSQKDEIPVFDGMVPSIVN